MAKNFVKEKYYWFAAIIFQILLTYGTTFKFEFSLTIHDQYFNIFTKPII